MELNRTYHNYINGEWTAALSGEQAPSVNPADVRETVGYTPLSGKEDVDLAVGAAKAAGLAWRKLAGTERANFLHKAANVLERRLPEIAETMTREMGKTLAEAKGETARGVAILRYYAGEGWRKTGDVIPASDGEALMFTTRVPLGVVGVISPWNFPVAIPIWKMAPALVFGNTVVLKPARETSVTAVKLVECLAEAGFPAGVVNLVCGSGQKIGQALAEHPDVSGLTFTGSNAVGKQVGQAAFSRGAKFQLEMGGKNPIIVAADADLELAVEATVSGGLKSTGQKCTATSRVIVATEVYEAFKAKLLDKIAGLKVGNGMDGSVWLGPCANDKQRQTVLGHIRRGIEEGATLLCGGETVDDPALRDGCYVKPTVFENANRDMGLYREEIFGPVLVLIRAESFAEAIDIANDNEFGLSASVYTANIGNMLAFVHQIEAGMVRVNAETAGVELQAPFGGMKQSSSHSREQGQAAVEFYTSIKTVYIKA